MAFALTVAYIVLTIISPDQFGPEWANYHVLRYLAAIIFVISLPGLLNSFVSKTAIQTRLVLGLIAAIAASQLANGWLGGVVESWEVFLPSAAVFFFIVANVDTTRRLKIVTLCSVAACLGVVVEALFGYYGGFRSELFVMKQNLYVNEEVVGQISRLRGAGFLNDPNDFAQMLLIALPLLFIAWRQRHVLANFLFVVIPAIVLLWTIYLTHSRGALIALAIGALMLARKKIGTTASAVLITLLVFGLLALDFTGGRGISAADGSDRLEAWASGLEMFKTAPLFGIGFGGFTDLNDITAHNSFVLCLAELGLVGATLWVASLVTTITGLNRIIRLQETAETGAESGAESGSGEETEIPGTAMSYFGSHGTVQSSANWGDSQSAESESAERPGEEPTVPINWVMAIRLALVSFIAAGWFLSRAYQPTMYLVLGLATAAISLQAETQESRVVSRWLPLTLASETIVIVFIYGVVRLRS